jgi:hypothetical protein
MILPDVEDSIEFIKLVGESGFKRVAHLPPNLQEAL